METCFKSEVKRHGNCVDHNAESEYVARSCPRGLQSKAVGGAEGDGGDWYIDVTEIRW